jgi:hypothetical protein
MPWETYKEFVTLIRTEEWFPHAEKFDACGRLGVPLDILVLGSLRYLGRGWTFDDIEESTSVSAETHRLFLHEFVKQCRERLYPKWVKAPETAEEIADSMAEFTEAGFPGCIGSTDATHIVMEKCSYRIRNNHLGGKSSLTTRAFQLTVNHRRQILASTVGLPGRWNDKSVVRFDGFVTAIRRGELYGDVKYTVKRGEGASDRTFQGLWLLVDGGYLNWSCTLCPLKETSLINEQRWSRWAESMRKDVECVFGILKGRWRILKTGIRLHGLKVVDDIWFTCCALHNMLLHVDGLNTRWLAGVRSPYQGRLGLHERGDVLRHVSIPRIFARVESGQQDNRAYDPTRRVRPDEYDRDDNYVINSASRASSVIYVPTVSFHSLRLAMINHFHTLWLEGNIKWPSRNGRMQ